jgi:hypothetical protein
MWVEPRTVEVCVKVEVGPETALPLGQVIEHQEELTIPVHGPTAPRLFADVLVFRGKE